MSRVIRVKKTIRLKKMDPIFIYYNNLEFKDKKIFNIEFSNEDRLQGV